MRELSLHILDIVENGLTAGATLIEMTIVEALSKDRLVITISDNGSGMPADKLENPSDPFITSRTVRKVGLGLSLLSAAAERCEGKLEIESKAGRGTKVTTSFQHSHIDRAPIGDMASTLATLLMGNPDVDFAYTHQIDDRSFSLDTREIKADMPDLSLQDPLVIHHLADTIRTNLKELAAKTPPAP